MFPLLPTTSTAMAICRRPLIETMPRVISSGTQVGQITQYKAPPPPPRHTWTEGEGEPSPRRPLSPRGRERPCPAPTTGMNHWHLTWISPRCRPRKFSRTTSNNKCKLLCSPKSRQLAPQLWEPQLPLLLNRIFISEWEQPVQYQLEVLWEPRRLTFPRQVQ